MNKEQEFTHQFKERDNTGEHRNGRLAQQKNYADGNDVPNEYTSHQNKNNH
ncbi:hypothetical protein [Sporolactobacillus nakayamae]|uniref:Uncharacterized protein n=1 Tax=Sporolactobacillus nakayamae TaxID=269670 RepID=A0A1I2UCY5_9BACL|nr:hypothetical protein [Sporolactobacillus nakayamae]SFG72551.1 hypothetical protein SAMN02982927_02563 [Sporolactobacillus nakayamae]